MLLSPQVVCLMGKLILSDGLVRVMPQSLAFAGPTDFSYQ